MTQEHYYSPNPTSAHRIKTFVEKIRGLELKFQTDLGVFSKDKLDRGTRLLINTLELPEGKLLDLGCGYGPIGVAMAKLAPHSQIYMVDINARAVDLAKQNLKLNGVVGQVFQGEGMTPVLEHSFDLIACNPPYRTGRQMVLALLNQAYQGLNPGGILYLVGRTTQGIKTIAKVLEESLGNCQEESKGGGFRVLTVRKN